MDRIEIDESFRPPWWLRGAHRQSILPSLRLRGAAARRRSAALIANSRELLLDCGDGVRLQAFHSSAAGDAQAAVGAVAVLVHGWEGSADSSYILSLATHLRAHGYDVVRLNLRDHGATHHLNRELFHSCRLSDVIGAVRSLQRQFAGRRMVLGGYSLGGNFMLRVAAAAPAEGLELDHVVAVSPLLDPARTMRVLEGRWSPYHAYFVLKWTRSLRKKQLVWPGHYDIEPLVNSRSLRAMTRGLVSQFTDFPDVDSYFAGYAITGERLAQLRVPSTIIAALDDPIIPAADLVRLATSDSLRIVLTRYGGHCGFLPALGGDSWANNIVLKAFSGRANEAIHT